MVSQSLIARRECVGTGQVGCKPPQGKWLEPVIGTVAKSGAALLQAEKPVRHKPEGQQARKVKVAGTMAPAQSWSGSAAAQLGCAGSATFNYRNSQHRINPAAMHHIWPMKITAAAGMR
jgi:hypothetical protein